MSLDEYKTTYTDLREAIGSLIAARCRSRDDELKRAIDAIVDDVERLLPMARENRRT